MNSINFIDKIANNDHPYVIAEIGINHNGDIKLAMEMIDAASDSKADCVKFQSFFVDKYISSLAIKAKYQEQKDFKSKTQKEIIKACEITIDQASELYDYAKKKGIDFLSTPFEVWSLKDLISIKVPAIKISSCNLTNIPFLEEAASSQVPILLSTGMGSLEEVTTAVNIFKSTQSPLLLFQCTSNYPSKPQNANLNVIKTFQKIFEVPVGLSDHTVSNTTSICAIALGAVAIEKHFTLSRKLPGIDQQASLEPKELEKLILDIRECKESLGSPIKFRTPEEENTATALRRSLVAVKDINIGDIFDDNNVSIMRPGNGLEPKYIKKLKGKKFTRKVVKGEMISLNDFLVI